MIAMFYDECLQVGTIYSPKIGVKPETSCLLLICYFLWFFFITLMFVYLQKLLHCLIICSYETNPSFSHCLWKLRSVWHWNVTILKFLTAIVFRFWYVYQSNNCKVHLPSSCSKDFIKSKWHTQRKLVEVNLRNKYIFRPPESFRWHISMG